MILFCHNSSCLWLVIVTLYDYPEAWWYHFQWSATLLCSFHVGFRLLCLAGTNFKGLGGLIWNSKWFWSSGDAVQNETDGIQDKCRDLPLGRKNQIYEYKWRMTLSAAVLGKTWWIKWSANGKRIIPYSKGKGGEGRNSPEGRIKIMLI